MKILVGITNYGTKNMEYLHALINEYKSMPYDVDIVMFSNIPKGLESDIEVIVGLPKREPWSLPFAHKKIFAERVKKYDLFIYTEDDILITERNIKAFLEVTEILPESEIAGFMRYELDKYGMRFYPDVHEDFHWEPNSIKTVKDFTFAHFTNEHSACYILTQNQLIKAIKSGGLLVAPYSRAPGKVHVGRYDTACSAATDPYTKCGFKKLICISHIQEFLVHHLPNVYVNKKYGLDSIYFDNQIETLLSLNNKHGGREKLFETEKKNLNTPKWDKRYYEPCNDDILAHVPSKAIRILSVGCGWGATEKKLIEEGKEVVAIPLDCVISKLAESSGVRTAPPNFEESFRILKGNIFDCIIFSDILQHLENPTNIIKKFIELMRDGGLLVVSVPNFHHLKVYKDLYVLGIPIACLKNFATSGLHPTTKGMVQSWFKQCGLKIKKISFKAEGRYLKYANLSPGIMKQLFASKIIFVCQK